MTPEEIDPVELPLECLGKMSVAQLEQFVSFIVKRSCGSGANSDHVATRPNWWPRELPFRYPVARRNITDLTKWRETLLNVLLKCPHYRCPDDKNIRRSDKATGKRTSTIPLKRQTNTRTRKRKVVTDDSPTENYYGKAFITQVEKRLTLNGRCVNKLTELEPVVSLCNVLLKPNPTEKQRDTVIKPVSKNEFLNYFNLSDKSVTVIRDKKNVCKLSHPLHLFNSQHIPFSSDLGIKLTKECNLVPQKVHQKKLERLERYLSTSTTAEPIRAAASEYEITYNKKSTCSHTYFFPSRQYRDRDSLSSKALFLLENHCRPCSVLVQKLNTIKPDDNNTASDSVTPDEIVNCNILQESSNNIASISSPVCEGNVEENDIIITPLQSLIEENPVDDKTEDQIKKNTDYKIISDIAVLLKPFNHLLTHLASECSEKSATTRRKTNTSNKRRDSSVEKRRVNLYCSRRYSRRLRLRHKTT